MYDYSSYSSCSPCNITVNGGGTVPRDQDILCGRGSTCYKHIGNQNFRFIVAVHLPKYTDPLTTRKEKGIMIQNIVNDLHNEGRRFLKEGIFGWFILCHKEAKYKVGHALRDAAAEMKRHLKGHLRRQNEKMVNSKEAVDQSTKDTIHRIEKESEDIRKDFSLSESSCLTKINGSTVATQSIEKSQVLQFLSSQSKPGEESRRDMIISSITHLLSEKDEESINDGDDDSWFETLFDTLSPTSLDDSC